MASGGSRMRELLKKYGKVGVGVHFSISAASIAGLYVAINNNVDVQSIFHKLGVKEPQLQVQGTANVKKNGTAELAASSGGALALAFLCNKALFPVRVPITLVLTPPVARFLARRQLIKTPS